MLSDALLISHVAGGTLGLLLGAFALAPRRGDRLLRRVGTAFSVGMLP